jgi:hypothetical protein
MDKHSCSLGAFMSYEENVVNMTTGLTHKYHTGMKSYAFLSVMKKKSLTKLATSFLNDEGAK